MTNLLLVEMMEVTTNNIKQLIKLLSAIKLLHKGLKFSQTITVLIEALRKYTATFMMIQ
jgi:hypothetical protein